MVVADVEVVATERVGPRTVALELETPAGFEGDPGQFVLVRATVDGEAIGRHYTLSSPDVGRTFEITVGVDPDGALSGWLADREPGDELRVEGPFGRVAYRGDEDVVVIAGGPGVGPAVGVAERALREGNSAAVVYRDEALAHGRRLSALAGAGAAVFVVDDALAPAVAAVVGQGRAYVFGFRDFVDAAREAIAAAGGDPDAAEIESFG